MRPMVSVCIPLYNRWQFVVDLLPKMLARTSYPLDRIEVLVCNDGPDQPPDDLPSIVRVLKTGNTEWRECATANNCLIRAARGEVLLFQDPEIEHLGDTITATVTALQDDRSVYTGPYELIFYGKKILPLPTAGRWCGVGAAFGVWRDYLMRLRGYDDRGTVWPGYSDHDLCKRLEQAGLHLVRPEQVRAYHHDHPRKKILRMQRRTGGGKFNTMIYEDETQPVRRNDDSWYTGPGVQSTDVIRYSGMDDDEAINLTTERLG